MYFATGIENSNPTINNGRTRVDEMETCGHYKHWATDFDRVQELGVSFLRYGPPLYKTFLGRDHFDWSFADATFADLRRRKIVPIVDLCHFGLPDWIGDFQNPDFPELFEAYASAFAGRFPWVQLYTPINEMFICALFSARYGWWNEQRHDDRSFVTALKHICKANLLAMKAILGRRHDAIFVQSESTEYFHPVSPDAIKAARARNAERFVTLDLTYAHPVDSETYQFLMDNGMTREEYAFFLTRSSGTPASWGTTITRPTSTAWGRTGSPGQRARSSVTVRSPATTSNGTGCRSCTRKPTSPRGRGGTRPSTGCGNSGPTSCRRASTASRSSGSRGTRSRT
jgi:hypothetical protein